MRYFLKAANLSAASRNYKIIDIPIVKIKKCHDKQLLKPEFNGSVAKPL